MMTAQMVRGLILASATALMFVSIGERQATAEVSQQASTSPMSTGLGSAGGVRGGGNPVSVSVKMAGKSVSGAALTFHAVHGASGTAALTATTNDDGVATLSLPAGSYTVTATTGSGSANKTVAVVASTSTMYIDLTLAPKTP